LNLLSITNHINFKFCGVRPVTINGQMKKSIKNGIMNKLCVGVENISSCAVKVTLEPGLYHNENRLCHSAALRKSNDWKYLNDSGCPVFL